MRLGTALMVFFQLFSPLASLSSVREVSSCSNCLIKKFVSESREAEEEEEEDCFELCDGGIFVVVDAEDDALRSILSILNDASNCAFN